MSPPSAWREMVLRTSELKAALGGGIKKVEDNELQTAALQRRAVRVTRDVPKDGVLGPDDLTVLRHALLARLLLTGWRP
jgi:sialic acid synthase SpsE